MAGIKICHITSVHPRYDTRIFHKECRGLAGKGYNVSLIVADGLGDEIKDGISIYDIGKSSSNRINRILSVPNLILGKAIQIDAVIYHFHDPELIGIGTKLKRRRKMVIYDVHEDVPAQILSKHYLPKFIRPFISHLFDLYEKKNAGKFDAILTATEFIRDKFKSYNPNSIDINNFPVVNELFSNDTWEHKENAIIYVGGINRLRGIAEVIKSIELTEKKPVFYLGGNFGDDKYDAEIMGLESYKYVKYLGYLNKEDYKILCAKAKIGIITDYPVENYINAYATKMFEYMEASIPFICSDFPIWKDFVNKYKCGIAVNPFDYNAIAKAIDYLLTHDEVASEMGKNGRIAVLERLNWTQEEQKLNNIYSKLCND